MTTAFADHAERALLSAEGALGLLNAKERPDAERLLELCRTHLTDGTAPPDLLREVLHLAEVLARRSAQAMPYAALARALSASTTGKEQDAKVLLSEFETKLSLLGM